MAANTAFSEGSRKETSFEVVVPKKSVVSVSELSRRRPPVTPSRSAGLPDVFGESEQHVLVDLEDAILARRPQLAVANLGIGFIVFAQLGANAEADVVGTGGNVQGRFRPDQ
ncbi:MAG: hypothetical protein U5R48_17200 [Gammaproteobacteria bacterium]|nr:hypothetical protein [Gammaproteobacteria bacterium]